MKKYGKAINPWEKIPHVNNFHWYEALRLTKWDVLALPADKEVYENILKVSRRLQWIRDYFGIAIVISSWYRPENYNTYLKDVHGYLVASRSAHLNGSGVDFRLYGLGSVDSINQTKSELYPHLEDLQCRICMNDDQKWIHLDIKGVGGFRY